jgi:hypothetical protein
MQFACHFQTGRSTLHHARQPLELLQLLQARAMSDLVVLPVMPVSVALLTVVIIVAMSVLLRTSAMLSKTNRGKLLSFAGVEMIHVSVARDLELVEHRLVLSCKIS